MEAVTHFPSPIKTVYNRVMRYVDIYIHTN